MFAPFQKIAEAKSQTVEQLVIGQLRSVLAIPLPLLEVDEETERVAFKFLSDDTLRSIAREQMSTSLQERMQILMTRNNFGTITDEEYRDLETLVEPGQRLTQSMGSGCANGTRLYHHGKGYVSVKNPALN